MQKYHESVLNMTGTPAAGVSVLVSLFNGGVATIYSDNGVTEASNPLTTNSLGYFEFYGADGRYTLTISGAGIETINITDVLLEDPQDGSAMVIDGGTISDSAISGGTVTDSALTNITIDGVAVAGADIAKYSRLNDDDGSSLTGHIAAGTGAQATTVQEKLRRAFINSADHDTLANALGASATNAVVDDATGNLFYRGKSVWGGGVTSAPADPIRHQWFAKNSLGQWFEALAVDDNGLADGNVVVVIPKFLSMGRTGTAGFIEFGPDLGAEAIITGSGSPNFHLLQRVSKQANSGVKVGVHSTGGHLEVARSSDNFASNSQILALFQASGVHEFRKHAGLTPTLRFIGTDGTTDEGGMRHDGNLRIHSSVGGMTLENTTQIYFGPNATTNPVFKIDNSVASQAAGLQLVGRAAGAGVDLSVISSTANESLRVSALGTGIVDILTGGNTALRINHVASGANGFALNPSTGTGAVSLVARGSGSDLTAILRGKGVNGVDLQDGASATKVGINTTGIGFYGATPVAKPTVSGSRGGNAALASLLTGLAALGLLTDSSTA